jgi:spore germination protein GerM
MKKKIIILIIVVMVAVVAVFAIKLFKNKNEVVLFSLKPNQTITSPLIIEGKARGSWFFEASFPVELVDEYDKHLAVGVAQAQGDPATGEVNWMTENFVNFKVQLEFVAQEDMNGFLIFRKDNPSGLPQNDKEFIVPVKILKTDNNPTSKIYIYFNNNKMDPEVSCNQVFPVERIIPKTQAIARAAIEELLKGQTVAEKSQGFFTSINSGVKIQSLIIDNSVAKIDFDEQLEFQIGGSCKVSAIRAQITETLKQFSTVKSVIISINGRTEDILQP